METQTFMANITLKIPDELHKKLKKHNEIRWSELMRKILINKINEFEIAEKLIAKSKFTFEDAKEISDEINSNVAKKLKIK